MLGQRWWEVGARQVGARLLGYPDTQDEIPRPPRERKRQPSPKRTKPSSAAPRVPGAGVRR